MRDRRRRPVTYDEFNTAIDALMKSNHGGFPTYDQVREALGGGSYRTIAKFFDRRFPETPMPTLAAETLARELAHVAVAAFEKPRTALLQVIGTQEGNKDALLRETGNLEDELDQVYARLEQAQGQIHGLQAQNQNLLQLNREERAANDRTLLELAKMSVRAEDCKELKAKVDELLAQVAVLKLNVEAAKADHDRQARRAAHLEKLLEEARKDLLEQSVELGRLKGIR